MEEGPLQIFPFLDFIMLCSYPGLLGMFPFERFSSLTASMQLIVALDRSLWDITNSIDTECHTQIESAPEIAIPVSTF